MNYAVDIRRRFSTLLPIYRQRFLINLEKHMKYIGSTFTKLTAFSVALAATLAVSVQAQPQQGTATVRAIKGSAEYLEGGAWQKLAVGKVLNPGTTIRTLSESQVDLYLKDNGPVIHVTADTLLGLDKLVFENTGADTVIETRLDLKNGRIQGSVKKTAATSVYEVKIPTGIVGIRGTDYDISTAGRVYVTDGSVLVHYTDTTTGTTTDYTVNAGQVFVAGRGVLEIKDFDPTYIPPTFIGGEVTIASEFYNQTARNVLLNGNIVPPYVPAGSVGGPILGPGNNVPLVPNPGEVIVIEPPYIPPVTPYGWNY